jgi:hypothetical protein
MNGRIADRRVVVVSEVDATTGASGTHLGTVRRVFRANRDCTDGSFAELITKVSR